MSVPSVWSLLHTSALPNPKQFVCLGIDAVGADTREKSTHNLGLIDGVMHAKVFVRQSISKYKFKSFGRRIGPGTF